MGENGNGTLSHKSVVISTLVALMIGLGGGTFATNSDNFQKHAERLSALEVHVKGLDRIEKRLERIEQKLEKPR